MLNSRAATKKKDFEGLSIGISQICKMHCLYLGTKFVCGGPLAPLERLILLLHVRYEVGHRKSHLTLHGYSLRQRGYHRIGSILTPGLRLIPSCLACYASTWSTPTCNTRAQITSALATSISNLHFKFCHHLHRFVDRYMNRFANVLP